MGPLGTLVPDQSLFSNSHKGDEINVTTKLNGQSKLDFLLLHCKIALDKTLSRKQKEMIYMSPNQKDNDRNRKPSISNAIEANTKPVFETQDLFESVRIPNIVVATDGTILAFAKSGQLLRRSEDGGKTWGPAQEVGHDANGSAIVDDNRGDVMVVSSGNGHLWRSRDHGQTWSERRLASNRTLPGMGRPTEHHGKPPFPKPAAR